MVLIKFTIMMTKNAHMSTSTLIRLDDIAENMNWQIMNRCESLFRNII